MGQDEEWRLLAEQVTQERDPAKLAKIIEALSRALDERERKKTLQVVPRA
jgi:hypothetical protein